MSLRATRRRISFGLSTLFGLAPRGFFIPYRYAGGVEAPERYPALEPIFADAEATIVARTPPAISSTVIR